MVVIPGPVLAHSEFRMGTTGPIVSHYFFEYCSDYVEWTPKLRQANKTHSSANGEWSYGSESTEVHAGV